MASHCIVIVDVTEPIALYLLKTGIAIPEYQFGFEAETGAIGLLSRQ